MPTERDGEIVALQIRAIGISDKDVLVAEKVWRARAEILVERHVRSAKHLGANGEFDCADTGGIPFRG